MTFSDEDKGAFERIKRTKLRIVSDGDSRSTRVTIMDSGEDISHLVTSITWRCDANHRPLAWAEVTLLAMDVDLIGETAPEAADGR